MFEMQKRRFEAIQEDETEDKRDSIDDFLLRELTRKQHDLKEKGNEKHFSKHDGHSDFDNTDYLDETSLSEKLKDQIKDGVGTHQDNLALKREEEKLKKMKRMRYLPDDGGD